MTDWKPGDPVYPEPPLRYAAMAYPEDRLTCAARHTPQFPVPRFRTQAEVRRDRSRYLPQLLDDEERA